MKRYLNRNVVPCVDNCYTVAVVRNISERNGQFTCVLGGKIIAVHTAEGLHPSKANLWFTNDNVSRETLEIAHRARRHR
jgi:hypothetical protein